MGWLFTPGGSRKSVIADITRSHESTINHGDGNVTRNVFDVVKHCFKGAVTHQGNLWCLCRYQSYYNGVLQDEKRWVMLCLMAYSKRDEGWGYKDVDESMGPLEVGCPQSYIDACTEPSNDYAREWREKATAHNAKVAKGIKAHDTATIGDILMLVPGTKPRFVEVEQVIATKVKGANRFSIRLVCEDRNGFRWRVKKTQVAANLGRVGWDDPRIQETCGEAVAV
jgi:hypothetical protein